MSVVRLDDHRAAGSEGGRGVAAGDGEGEWEVAGTEHGNRPEGDLALTDVCTRQRAALGLGRVDAGSVPTALAQNRSEQAELTGGAADLAVDQGSDG